MPFGRSFHSEAAAHAIRRSPYVFVRIVGRTKRCKVFDQRGRFGEYCFGRSLMYHGAVQRKER